MLRFRGLPWMVVLLTATCGFVGTASAQWRGHYVHRVGPHGHEVERYRWGGGITPTGGAVLMRGIDVFGPIVGGLIGKSAEEATETKAATKSTLATCESYARAQEDANALLVRTATLVNNLPPLGGTSPLSSGDVTSPGEKPRGDTVTPTEAGQLGTNPWSLTPAP